MAATLLKEMLGLHKVVRAKANALGLAGDVVEACTIVGKAVAPLPEEPLTEMVPLLGIPGHAAHPLVPVATSAIVGRDLAFTPKRMKFGDMAAQVRD